MVGQQAEDVHPRSRQRWVLRAISRVSKGSMPSAGAWCACGSRCHKQPATCASRAAMRGATGRRASPVVGKVEDGELAEQAQLGRQTGSQAQVSHVPAGRGRGTDRLVPHRGKGWLAGTLKAREQGSGRPPSRSEAA